MKLKNAFVSSLICVILMTSMGSYCTGFSQDLTVFKDGHSASSTQLVADSQDPSQEFREGFKANPTSQINSVSFSYVFIASQCSFKVMRNSQYEAYLQKQLFQRPSPTFFLDFRSLII